VSAHQFAIEAEDLGKIYKRWDGPWSRALEVMSRGRRQGHREVRALEGVSFKLPAGGALGIVGANGAGKSTLLKLLSGTTAPTSGRFRVSGRSASLLELGAGFHPGFSARDNAFQNAVLLGLRAREARRRVEEALEFAELMDVADEPVGTFSTGMGMRLGFAAAMSVEPEVLILDEVFAVGDQAFQKKCVDRLAAFRDGGGSLVLCSHALYDIRQMCDEALWLDNGQLAKAGDACEVTHAYAASQIAEDDVRRVAGAPPQRADWPRITGAEVVLSHSGLPARSVQTGEDIELRVTWENPNPVDHPIQLGVGFVRGDQTLCAAAATHHDGVKLTGAGGVCSLRLPRLSLLAGTFLVKLWLFDDAGVFRYQETALDHDLLVRGAEREVGLVRLDHSWHLEGTALQPNPWAFSQPKELTL
jgi:lipopolysaccharide transport system ATP-binding protein